MSAIQPLQNQRKSTYHNKNSRSNIKFQVNGNPELSECCFNDRKFEHHNYLLV